MTTDHHISRDDLAGYVLGALPEREAAVVETHVEACDKCQEDVRWLRPALEILPEAVEQMDPPPALRANLLDITRQDAELNGTAHRRKPVRERRLRIGRFVLAPMTVLAAVAIAIAAFGGYSLNEDGDGTRTISVASANTGTATLQVSDDSATLQAHDVPQLPAGGVYQVWVAFPGQPVKPTTDFLPGDDGTAAAAVPEVLHGAEQVMVTAEPARGATKPSSAPIYSASIDA